MHHLPRLFSFRHGKDMDRRKNSRKPKLERRNALKRVEYDAGSSSSSLDDSASLSSSLHTRSLDLSDRTSFRIEGIDGELDVICQTLGLSGPEDFAIPAAAWEARKIRSSSDLLPRSRLQGLDSPKPDEVEDTAVRTEIQAQAQAQAVAELMCERIADTVRIVDETELTRTDPAESSGCCVPGGCSGIKGIRPPVLQPPVLKPPPGMRLHVIDNACSTWDLLKHFAPDAEKGSSVMVQSGLLSSSSDDEVEEEEDEEEEEQNKGKEKEVEAETVKREVEENIARLVETAALSESSCSFSTSNDDDSSSTTTEPTSNISPNGRFKRNITYWEKGELLGRGSFGSVYEGISE
jgi:mitogen-activated protein kinase kinase kinase 1